MLAHVATEKAGPSVPGEPERKAGVALEVPEGHAGRTAAPEQEDPRCPGQPEPPGAGAPGVDHEHAALAPQQRLVRVADDEDIGPVAGKLARKAAVPAVMSHEDSRPRGFPHEELGERAEPRARVVVAAHGVERRDAAQPREQRFVHRVPRHQDPLDSGEHLRQEGVEPPVQVGDEPEAHGGL